MSDSKKEFLTFEIGTEEYAVEILRVQEIRGWKKPNPLPNVPKYVKGVVDLRGTVVPIIDLREKFKLPSSYDGTTVVIVVHVITALGERIVGLVVDAVSDVQGFDVNKLQPAPDVSTSIQNQFVLGLATIENDKSTNPAKVQNEIDKKKHGRGRMVIVIDIDKLASEGLIEAIEKSDSHVPLRNG